MGYVTISIRTRVNSSEAEVLVTATLTYRYKVHCQALTALLLQCESFEVGLNRQVYTEQRIRRNPHLSFVRVTKNYRSANVRRAIAIALDWVVRFNLTHERVDSSASVLKSRGWNSPVAGLIAARVLKSFDSPDKLCVSSVLESAIISSCMLCVKEAGVCNWNVLMFS